MSLVSLGSTPHVPLTQQNCAHHWHLMDATALAICLVFSASLRPARQILTARWGQWGEVGGAVLQVVNI